VIARDDLPQQTRPSTQREWARLIKGSRRPSAAANPIGGSVLLSCIGWHDVIRYTVDVPAATSPASPHHARQSHTSSCLGRSARLPGTPDPALDHTDLCTALRGADDADFVHERAHEKGATPARLAEAIRRERIRDLARIEASSPILDASRVIRLAPGCPASHRRRATTTGVGRSLPRTSRNHDEPRSCRVAHQPLRRVDMARAVHLAGLWAALWL
jgi:hypothetical protein